MKQTTETNLEYVYRQPTQSVPDQVVGSTIPTPC